MNMTTIVANNSHTHTTGNITGVSDEFDKDFGTSAGTVAEGDHTHAGLGSGITTDTIWKNESNVNTYGKYTNGYLTETGAWFAMSGSITESSIGSTDAVEFDITIVYQTDPLESTGYVLQIIAGDATGGINSGGTGTGNTVAKAIMGGPPGAFTTYELRDVYSDTQLDTVTATIS